MHFQVELFSLYSEKTCSLRRVLFRLFRTIFIANSEIQRWNFIANIHELALLKFNFFFFPINLQIKGQSSFPYVVTIEMPHLINRRLTARCHDESTKLSSPLDIIKSIKQVRRLEADPNLSTLAQIQVSRVSSFPYQTAI